MSDMQLGSEGAKQKECGHWGAGHRDAICLDFFLRWGSSQGYKLPSLQIVSGSEEVGWKVEMSARGVRTKKKENKVVGK